jgi:hypothetical protein
MKTFFVLISLLTAFSPCFSQKHEDPAPSRIFTKASLSEVRFITEIIPDSPKYKNITHFEVVGKVGGKVLIANGKGHEMDEEARNILRKWIPGLNFMWT